MNRVTLRSQRPVDAQWKRFTRVHTIENSAHGGISSSRAPGGTMLELHAFSTKLRPRDRWRTRRASARVSAVVFLQARSTSTPDMPMGFTLDEGAP